MNTTNMKQILIQVQKATWMAANSRFNKDCVKHRSGGVTPYIKRYLEQSDRTLRESNIEH